MRMANRSALARFTFPICIEEQFHVLLDLEHLLLDELSLRVRLDAQLLQILLERIQLVLSLGEHSHLRHQFFNCIGVFQVLIVLLAIGTLQLSQLLVIVLPMIYLFFCIFLVLFFTFH